MARVKPNSAEKKSPVAVAPSTPSPVPAEVQAAQSASQEQAGQQAANDQVAQLATETPASSDAGTEGAAAVQENTPQVAAAVPTTRAGQLKPVQDERRFATVASRIEHDGEVYAENDLILLTEGQFKALRRGGSIMEEAWDDCDPA